MISVHGDALVWRACGDGATEQALDTLYGMIAEPTSPARSRAATLSMLNVM